MKIDEINMTGVIQLSAAHAVVMPHKPSNLSFDDLSKKLIEHSQAELLSFGLFDNATPNYATFYPDVTKEDLEPKDEEFIFPVFRMLSETIVSKYAPIDFGKKGVLKKSMQMLLGQTINIDHEMAVGNAIGAVSEVFWQNSYKTNDGKIVPAGINATLKIDGKSNPRIARGIMMSPPSIHSNSVTVKFKWEPSHEFEESSEFYNKIGTYNKDGELIRLIVTNILAYHETSLVSHGADPFAQKIGSDGKLNDAAYAHRVKSFAVDKPVSGHFTMDYKEEMLSMTSDGSSPDPIILNNNNNNNDEKSFSMKELVKKLTEELGFEADVLTEENLSEKIVELVTGKDTSIQTLTDSKATLQTEVDNLTTENQTLKDNEAGAETILESTRNEAVRLYKLSKGDKAEENIISLIGNSNSIDVVKAFVTQYQDEVDAQFAATCNKCGSNDVSRLTAKSTKDGLVTGDGGKPIDEEFTNKDNQEVLDNLKNKFKKPSRILKSDKD